MPPTRRRWTRLPVVAYAHPFELGLGAAFIIIGVKGLLSGHTSPSIDSLPVVSVVMYRAAQLAAGIGILAGLALRRQPLGRAVERASCYVLGAALISFATLLIGRNGAAGWDVGLVCAFIGLAAIARARAIAKTERVITRTLAEVARDPIALRRLVDGRPPYTPDDEDRA